MFFCRTPSCELEWSLSTPQPGSGGGQVAGLKTERHEFTADSGDYSEIDDPLEKWPRGVRVSEL